MSFRWWHAVVLAFIAVDIAVLNYFSFISLRRSNTVSPTITAIPTVNDQCPSTCQQYVDQKIAALPTMVSTKPIITAAAVPAKTKVRTVSYLPISIGGSTGNSDWTALPGTDFYFDTSDYPGLVEIYFEATAKLFNGNGLAFVRLYDATHGVGVQGSQVQTEKQTDTIVTSGQVSFYRGKNLIQVQAKSLTADTAIFTSGRLRIVTEN
jgi:hypothetical protein